MADEPSPEELEARLEELADSVEELREELQPRGPFGLPRPPTPAELAGFTAEYTIPAAIAGLEATVRSLELLQAALRAADPESRRTERRERARRAGDAVLDRLDDALADIRTAVEDADAPPNPAARELLKETRRLSEEVRDAIEEPHPTEDGTESDPTAAIDEEIQTIRRELDDGAENGDG